MSKIPKWLNLVAERDYLDFVVRSSYAELKKRPPINKLIDQATGFDKEQMRNLAKMVNRIEKINMILTNAGNSTEL